MWKYYTLTSCIPSSTSCSSWPIMPSVWMFKFFQLTLTCLTKVLILTRFAFNSFVEYLTSFKLVVNVSPSPNLDFNSFLFFCSLGLNSSWISSLRMKHCEFHFVFNNFTEMFHANVANKSHVLHFRIRKNVEFDMTNIFFLK